MPADIVADVEKLGVEVKQTDNFSEAAAVSDVLYVTRIQKERFENETEYDLVKDDFIVDSVTC
jgi:aspartate carbamoyltransferase catalytic subunit